VNLVIGGKAISGTPAPNQKIPLPGIGYVVLNQQTSHVGSNSVIGIHLVVTTTSQRAKSGTTGRSLRREQFAERPYQG
jgi:hypothetical protein